MSIARIATLLAASMAAVPNAAHAQEPAGRILWTLGQVERINRDGTSVALAKGDAVFEGDLIRSASGSQAQLLMRDEALVAVRPDSELRLATYLYAGREDGTERAVVELLKGGLRSITGAIGRTHKDHYQLRSNGHLVGIRGTDHETFRTDEGTFNRVTMGGTYLKSGQDRVDLQPGEVGFASHRPGVPPSRLERTPDFMQLAVWTRGDTGPRMRDVSPKDAERLQATAPAAPPAQRGSATLSPRSSEGLGENKGPGETKVGGKGNAGKGAGRGRH